MPNRSIRDELQGVERNRVKPSDPEQVRAALYGNPATPKPSSSSRSPDGVVRRDPNVVRGPATDLSLTNSGGRARRQKIDEMVDKAVMGK